MTWRTAHAIDSLRSEINQRWPYRSKVSDGTIGDAAHASRDSDHNPWVHVDGIGVVRAFDCTAVGINPDAYAEFIRARGIAGDPRLVGGGYVIWNKRIASERNGWAWRRYTGSNGHTHHIHVSLTRNPAGFDSRATWGIAGIGKPTAPRPFRTFAKGATDAAVYAKGGQVGQVTTLQRLLGVTRDGIYGPKTVAAVVAFKEKAGWTTADSRKHDRTSTVDARFIDALRNLAKP